MKKAPILISALLCLLSAPATGSESVSAEEISRRLAQPKLREKTSQCVREFLSCPLRVFGTMRFHLFTDSKGGGFGFTLDSPAFARTTMFSCMKQAVLSLLAPASSAESAFRIELRLRLLQEDPDDFQLEMAIVDLRAPAPRPPLTGSFSRVAGGWFACCSLADGSRLNLFLGASHGATSPSKQALDDDLFPCSNGASKVNNNHKLSGGDACACAASHLTAEASERLQAARWLLEKGCRREYRRVLKLLRCEYGLLPDKKCRLQPGPLHLRRALAKAVLDKFGWLPDGVVEKVVEETAPAERLSVLKEFLLLHPRLFSRVADFFLGQSDQVLVALAAGLSCTLGMAGGRATAQRLLADPRPGVRLLALLHARPCLRGMLAEQLGELQKEPLLFLLASRELTSLPEAYLPLVSQALEHPCPVVRFLAAGELARSGASAAGVVQSLIEREPDPLLRQRLQALADGGQLENLPLVQIWLEPGGAE